MKATARSFLLLHSSWLLSLSWLLVSACSTELNSAARGVRVAKAVPHSNCQELDFVYGSASGAGFTSTERKMRSAHNDLRNRAATLGANLVVLNAAGSDVSGYVFAGHAFKCGEEPEPPPEEVAVVEEEPERAAVLVAPAASVEPEPTPDPNLPQGSVGFRFDDTREEASNTCLNAGFAWTQERTQSKCSGLPVPPGDVQGAPGEAQVEFCEDKVCKIVVILRPTERQFQRTFTEVKARVHERYGAPRALNDTLTQCKGTLTRCLTTGNAQLEAYWSWPTGYTIDLAAAPGKTRTEKPFLQLRHTKSQPPEPDKAATGPAQPAF